MLVDGDRFPIIGKLETCEGLVNLEPDCQSRFIWFGI